MDSVHHALRQRPYPGRGCLAARTTAGDLVLAYFLTGRSAASRSRELVRTERGDVVVRDKGARAFDPLRHYVAATRRGDWSVVGNGDQVEPLADALASGTEVMTAWSAHTFEPDPPIFTTRIWMAHRAGGADCLAGYARHAGRDETGVDRVAWVVDRLPAGTGLLMTTYSGTAEDVTLTVAPISVALSAPDAPAVLDEVWRGLSPELRVAAFAVLADDPDGEPVIVASPAS